MSLGETGRAVGARTLTSALLLGAVTLACDSPTDNPFHLLIVSIESYGVGFDLDGYVLAVDDVPPVAVGTQDRHRFDGLTGSSHLVTLSDLADNCFVEGDNPRTVDVLPRRWPGMTFVVKCSVSFNATIAFARFEVSAPYSKGIAALEIPTGVVTSLNLLGGDPSWSPDGARLAYAREDCSDPYYWPPDCESLGISVMEFPGGDPVELTSNADGDPSWRPDGRAIVFERVDTELGSREAIASLEVWERTIPWEDLQRVRAEHRNGLYTINIDGTGEAKIPLPPEVSAAWDPAWSPDGTRLAFGCSMENDDGAFRLCVANIDGTRPIGLYGGGWAQDPAWSPDGSRIAFATLQAEPPYHYMILIVNADGTGLAQLHPGTEPVWSPDGDRLVFRSFPEPGLWSIGPDGADLIVLAEVDTYYTPAWRP